MKLLRLYQFLLYWVKIPFAGSKLRWSCAILCASSNVSDAQGRQGILLFAFISQGSRAQVENQVQAVQKAPGSKQLEVLIMLWAQRWGKECQKTQHILLEKTKATELVALLDYPNIAATHLSSSSAGVADGLSNHFIDLQLLPTQILYLLAFRLCCF